MFTSLDVLLSAYVCLCSWYGFQNMLFDSDLPIHGCLSLYATWHSSYRLLGNFWLSWTCMFRS